MEEREGKEEKGKKRKKLWSREWEGREREETEGKK